jgi:hypothetical protein
MFLVWFIGLFFVPLFMMLFAVGILAHFWPLLVLAGVAWIAVKVFKK